MIVILLSTGIRIQVQEGMCLTLASNPRLKDNLFSLDNGYYISKNDPLFWKKLLNRRPENQEAMYHVGLGLENDAKYYLDKYYATKLDKYLSLYRRFIKKASDLMNGSFNKGFLPARLDVLRMEREMKLTERNISEITNKSISSINGKILLLVATIVLSLFLAIFFIPNRVLNTTHYFTNNYSYMLPYEVIEKKPPTRTFIHGTSNQPKIIQVKRGASKEELVNALVGRLKTDYEMDPITAKRILAVDEDNREMGMAFWAGRDNNIQVYIYPSDSSAFMDNQERLLWETATVVRSASYQFVKKNGYLPKDLGDLNQPFPNNYLTELPKDPYKLKNTVTLAPSGDGGWLFSLKEIPLNGELVSVVKDAIKPNITYTRDIPFSPLYISIDKENHTLSIISGDKIIRRYSVALGKDGTTPEGDFYISKKIMNPDKIVPESDNVYGTRAMELSNVDLAIHGTNTPASIGKDVSHGCIRLNKLDMEDLYAVTPLNTPVKIAKNDTTPKDFYKPDTPEMGLYSHSANSKEEDNFHMYHWAN